jgi:hypothetical protein
LRAVLIIITGFLILFSVSTYTAYSISNTANELKLKLRETEKYIHSESWDKALSSIETTSKEWSDVKKRWAIVLNHTTLSNIEISINRLKQYTLTKNTSLSLGELNTLIILLQDIPQSEYLRFHNIF